MILIFSQPGENSRWRRAAKGNTYFGGHKLCSKSWALGPDLQSNEKQKMGVLESRWWGNEKMVMSCICLPDDNMQDAQDRRRRSQCTTKTEERPFKNHIITRMLRGSLNTTEAVDDQWLAEIISLSWNANSGIIRTVFRTCSCFWLCNKK